MASDDAFDCFGDDDDESVEASPSTSQEGNTSRDPTCGILAFHTGTEQSLLNHVELELNKHGTSPNHTGRSRAGFVLDAIDDFSLKRHWMMHVGNEKGAIVKKFVQDCCDANPGPRSLTFVELGSYCGYSAILLANTMKEIGRDCHLYSVEVVGEHARVASRMVELAGLSDQISIILLDPYKEQLENILKQKLTSRSTIDFLFIDHDKSLYLSDLKRLEMAGLVQEGCHVAADNVVFAQIDDYRQYVAKLSEEGQVSTRLENSWLEYSQPDQDPDGKNRELMRDGIARISVLVETRGERSRDFTIS